MSELLKMYEVNNTIQDCACKISSHEAERFSMHRLKSIICLKMDVMAVWGMLKDGSTAKSCLRDNPGYLIDSLVILSVYCELIKLEWSSM